MLNNNMFTMKQVQTTSNETNEKTLKIIIYMLKNTNKRNFHIISRKIIEFALTWSAFGRCG